MLFCRCFGCNSVKMAHKIAAHYPQHIHVVEKSLMFHQEIDIYIRPYNYSRSYSMHIYNQATKHYIPYNEDELKRYNCTLGNAMRQILYGSPELLDKNNTRNGQLRPGEKRGRQGAYIRNFPGPTRF